MQSQATTLTLPNGHTVLFEPLPDVSSNAYVVKIMDGDEVLSVTCSCNGVSKTCAKGIDVSCDCGKDPPEITCS